MKRCRSCQNSFEISDADRAFYQKMQVTEPTLCPDCRSQRRLAFRNERTLYKRSCDSCKRSMVSVYRPDTAFPVFCAECWWSDRWDPLSYGRDFDFNRPFFDQFRDLIVQVPKIYSDILNSENSEYTNISFGNKDCYMAFAVMTSERCFYSRKLVDSKVLVDSTHVYRSELCYECVDCADCYGSAYLEACKNCSDSLFLMNCIGCHHCIGCTNLRNQSYVIFNEAVSESEFQKKYDQIKGSSSAIQALKKKFDALKRIAIRRPNHNTNALNCTGDYLENCKNCSDCYDLGNTEESRYITDSMTGASFSMDCTATTAHSIWNYESLSTTGASYCWFSNRVRDGGHHLHYSDSIYASESLFGCVGLRHKKYCILNKQYSKEDYERMVARIVARMVETKEWGEFFPTAMSCFGYNETMAMDFYPMTKSEVSKKGWSWHDMVEKKPDATRVIPGARLPDRTADIPDDVLNWAIQCEATGRLFKLIPQELKFYRDRGLPIPRLHPDERHHRRLLLRNPRRVYDRACAKCGTGIQTTYSPDRPEIVYCEQCYLKEVY